MRPDRLIRAASSLLAWLAGLPLLAMMLVTVVDVVGRYALGKPLVGGHALVQTLVFALVFLGLPLLSLLRAYMQVEWLGSALPAKLERLRQRVTDGVTVAGLVAFGAQFLWQGAYYQRQGETIEMLEIPLALFGYLGGGLCLLAALLSVVTLLLPRNRVGA